MWEIITITKDLLFPKVCFGCERLGLYVCKECQGLLSSFPFQRCIVCQKPSLSGWTHPKCRTAYTPDRLISIFDYQHNLIARLLNTAKLGMVPDIFAELAEISSTFIEDPEKILNSFVLCPIPARRSRIAYRGFNQSQVIAHILSVKWNLVLDRLLLKNKATKQQKHLKKNERKQNLKGSFGLVDNKGLPHMVILIDDITTTGSTFLEASKVLKMAKVKKVWCLALAQD